MLYLFMHVLVFCLGFICEECVPQGVVVCVVADRDMYDMLVVVILCIIGWICRCFAVHSKVFCT